MSINKQKGFIPILIAIIATAIVTTGAGYGAYKYNETKEKNILSKKNEAIDTIEMESENTLEDKIEEKSESVSSNSEPEVDNTYSKNINTDSQVTIPQINNQIAPAPIADNNSDTNLEDILDYLDSDFSKQINEAEKQIKQLREKWDEMQDELKPLQEEIDELLERMKSECSTGGFMTGSSAQNCLQISSDMQMLSVEYNSVLASYGFGPTSSKPSSGFELRDSFNAGSEHYKVYYDGNGNGEIYNIYDLTDSYNFYCGSGSCDIFGN